MQITFTRQGERSYSTVIVRDDKVTIEVPSYDRPDWLPHDLAHYVVEFNLGLAEGFWGRVAAGAVYPGMKILTGRQAAHATDRSRTLIRENSQTGTEAEVLVGLFVQLAQQGLENDRDTVRVLLGKNWQSARSTRPALQLEEVRQICRKLGEMQQEWKRLATGQDITVTWPRTLLARL